MGTSFGKKILWVLFGVLSVIALSIVYQQALKPRQALLPNPYSEEPDYDGIAKKITGATLQEDLDQYLQFGSRFTGSEGFEKLGDHLIAKFEELGYRIVLQEHEVVIPKTHFCEILDENGDPVPNLTPRPWYPNRLRTATTPPEGITGKVTYKGDPDGEDKTEALDACEGGIMLLRARERFQDYANFGARAVVYFDEDEHDTKPHHFRNKESHASVNVPAIFVEGTPEDALALESKTITIKCRVDWTRVTVRNILAILDPDPSFDQVREETLVVNSYYDSWSSIPDCAPGARQALSLQTLMLAAENLAKTENRSKLRRKVVFAVTGGRGQACSGSRHFAAALGTEAEPEKLLERLDEEQEECEEELEQLKQLVDLAPKYFEEGKTRKAHKAFWKGKKDLLTLFRQELEYVVDQKSAVADDELIEARLDWLRAGSAKGPELEKYLIANKKSRIYQSLVNAKPYILVEGGGYTNYFDKDAPILEENRGLDDVGRPDMYEASYEEFLQQTIQGVKDRLAFRIKRNEFYLRQIEQDRTVFREIRGEDGTRRLASIEINFSDKTNQMVLGSGGWWWATRSIPADREFALQFKYAQEKLNPLVKEKFKSVVPTNDVQSCGMYYELSYFHTSRLTFSGFTSFVILTRGDNREFFACIKDTPDDIKWDNVVDQSRIAVAGLEQIALGGAKFIPVSMPVQNRDFGGLTTSVRGNSLVPNHAEPNCVVQLTDGIWSPRSWRHFTNGGGYWSAHMDPYPVTMSDELGRWRFRNVFARNWWRFSFHAARSDPETGDIEWITDLGYAQKYPTQNLRTYQIGELTRIVVFRCTPIHIFKAENPKNMKLYDRVEARLIRGFSAPKRYFYEQFYAGEYVLYLEPDAQFFPVFLFGSPHNQSLLRISAISLNLSPETFETNIKADQEDVEGKGYLAADTTFIYHPEDDLARSMSALNTRRQLRYKKYNLLDDHTNEAADKARKLAIDAQVLREHKKHYEAFKMMKESLAYSTTVHPVIKDSKAEAVYGIVFYLLLLIPFAFFMEKLTVGHPDIRRQILIVGFIFLGVFFALRAVHPAFEIVRSSFMILLGFITLILSLLVTFFVSSKFRAAVLQYQKIIHGQQTAAEVTKASAAFTGFLLGINNMRKRKVRTALTAITLVLITFVMICFTAVDNDFVEVIYPIGKAPYTGIEIRKNTLGHLGTQTTVLVNAFEADYTVAVRRWDVAGLWGIMPMNKKLEAETYITPEEVDNLPVTLVRDVDGKTTKWVSKGSMGIGPAPSFKVEDVLVCGDRWFKTESEKSCVLSLAAAHTLGITPEMVKEEPYPTIVLEGRELDVVNLFDEEKLDAYRDRKEKPITPIDLEAELVIKEKEEAEEKAAAKAAEEAAARTVAPDGSDGAAPAEEAKEEKPKREPIRLAASGLILFPKQRQPKPESIISHFKGKLRLNQDEPISFDKMFITNVPPHEEDETHEHYWFRDDDPATCFIPARMAAEMKISPQMVENQKVQIMVEGTALIVKGIYDAARFEQVHDLDGEGLAPYDVESIIGRPSEDTVEEDEMPEMMKRLSGDDIIICNDRSTTNGWHVASIAIDLSVLGSHKRTRQLIDRYLEKTGSKAFYGIGDTAYFGAKFRRPRGSNYLELLIPLLIASLTVLNTMRGSVYERRDEIYVYNAVGLNPFHIFFLFIAEACVYAVVGALGGYLVANFAGKFIRVLGWQAGLTINYSSIYAVLYSLVIMVAVFLSTWFPARAAAKLAAPADEMKWTIPDPVDGIIAFALPFTFNIRDRVAIISYFMNWFDEFGEGSSGKFYAAPPTCTLERHDELPMAAVKVVTWLRPYDLGVSQEVAIEMREDTKNDQTIAYLKLTHLSGDISSWQRANYLFLKLLRKHFLGWRVVPEEEKEAFLERSRIMFTTGKLPTDSQQAPAPEIEASVGTGTEN